MRPPILALPLEQYMVKDNAGFDWSLPYKPCSIKVADVMNFAEITLELEENQNNLDLIMVMELSSMLDA